MYYYMHEYMVFHAQTHDKSCTLTIKCYQRAFLGILITTPCGVISKKHLSIHFDAALQKHTVTVVVILINYSSFISTNVNINKTPSVRCSINFLFFVIISD